MKNKIKINSLFILYLLVILSSCSKKSFPSAEVNFLSNKEGTICMKAIGIGINQENAIIDAEKNAFNVIFFRGLPQSEQKTPLIGTNETEEILKHADYFDKFYKGKRYKTFIMSSFPTSNLVKRKGGEKYIAINVTINLVALRTDLEQNNIIRKFGY